MTTDKLVRDVLPRAMTYKEYRELVEQLANEGLSTAPDPKDQGLANFTKLNHTRMNRLDKKSVIPTEAREKLSFPAHKQTWLVITESWCGDAAQIIPLIHKMAQLNPMIDLRLVMRDRETELMDAFLTGGARSIPLVIIYDHELGKVVARWGPRPSALTKLVNKEKAQNGVLSPEFKKEIQLWYNRDKGQTTITDFVQLLEEMKRS